MATPEAPKYQGKPNNILINMRVKPLRRLTAAVISQANLTPADQRLGDWVMDELKASS